MFLLSDRNTLCVMMFDACLDYAFECFDYAICCCSMASLLTMFASLSTVLKWLYWLYDFLIAEFHCLISLCFFKLKAICCEEPFQCNIFSA